MWSHDHSIAVGIGSYLMTWEIGSITSVESVFCCRSVLWHILPVVSIPVTWWQDAELYPLPEPSKGEILQIACTDVLTQHERNISQIWHWEKRSSENWQNCCPHEKVEFHQKDEQWSCKPRCLHRKHFIKIKDHNYNRRGTGHSHLIAGLGSDKTNISSLAFSYIKM